MDTDDRLAETTERSPAEHTEAPAGPVEQIPSQHDMTVVHNLSGVVARLEQELELARLQLRDAWALVPVDSSILKKPYKSDIAVTCRVCGKPTVWRTAKGLAEHQPECPAASSHSFGRKNNVSQEVWDMLRGLTGDDNDESLDDE